MGAATGASRLLWPTNSLLPRTYRTNAWDAMYRRKVSSSFNSVCTSPPHESDTQPTHDQGRQPRSVTRASNR